MIDSKDLKDLRKIAEEATPGQWTGTGNYPFYVDIKKPAPSLSKHDRERPTYWRYQDGVFVLAFSPKQVLELFKHIDELETKLKEKEIVIIRGRDDSDD